MTNSYRPIPAPDYVSGLTSQYRRDSQNLANLQAAMRRNDNRRVQVAGQGMEFLGALANFSATAASKYQQVKEKREAKKSEVASQILSQFKDEDRKYLIDKIESLEFKDNRLQELINTLPIDQQETPLSWTKPADITRARKLHVSRAINNLPTFVESGLLKEDYDINAPIDIREEKLNTVFTNARDVLGLNGLTPEINATYKVENTIADYKDQLRNKAYLTNVKANKEQLIKDDREIIINSIREQNGTAGTLIVGRLKILADKKGNGDRAVGMPLAKNQFYKEYIVDGLASGALTPEMSRDIRDDIVERDGEVDTFEKLYMNAEQVKMVDQAEQDYENRRSEKIKQERNTTKLTTESDAITKADDLIISGDIDGAKDELIKAQFALSNDGLESTVLNEKLESFKFTPESLLAERKELQERLLDGQLSSEELNQAYYPNKVEFQDEVEKLERIKNTVEYKNNKKSLKALMQSELVVSGNDSFFRGYGASIHADLERRYRKNILMNEASPAEAAAEVEQHYKINGGGIDGVNKGLKYSFNTNDKTHTAYGNQLGVGVRNLSIINKRNNIQNQLQSGKKIDQIQFFSKGEVEDIIENYQTTGKLNDFARGSLHGIENKIEIINATAKSYGIEDEIEEPEAQKEFIDNLTPKDRTLVNYKGLENLDSEIILRMLQPRILRPFIK